MNLLLPTWQKTPCDNQPLVTTIRRQAYELFLVDVLEGGLVDDPEVVEHLVELDESLSNLLTWRGLVMIVCTFTYFTVTITK